MRNCFAINIDAEYMLSRLSHDGGSKSFTTRDVKHSAASDERQARPIAMFVLECYVSAYAGNIPFACELHVTILFQWLRKYCVFDH